MPQSFFDIATGTDDQFVYKSSAAYPPSSAVGRSTTEVAIYPMRSFRGDNNYWISCALLRWDTSSLPRNSIITGASLRWYPYDTGGAANSRNITGDWYLFDGTDADYSETALTTAFSGFAMAGITVGNYYTIPLSNPTNYISRSGYTGLRLHVDGGQPTGGNELYWASFEHTTADPPQLIVYYNGEGPGAGYIQIGP